MKKSGFFDGVVFGMIVGGIVALLFSPEKGKKNRKYVADLLNNSNEIFDETKESAEELIKKTKSSIEESLDRLSKTLEEVGITETEDEEEGDSE